MKFKKIAIIGGGNLGFSLTRGLLETGDYKKDNIIVSEIRERRRDFLSSYGFQVTSNNKQAVAESGLVIVAVKPQQVNSLLEEIV